MEPLQMVECIILPMENSLKNLQTDYLDVLLLHRPSPLMQADEIAEAVLKLKSDGKIMFFDLPILIHLGMC